ncbi:tripartite tricarboxylate transporter substrate binding protein [Comamonas piscis]|uniref:Tripartite tricarboxylate transporter substrate binding protein n=1 Tax=Comamonas piscis TaxID=1562974 RepID=A0A7G5ECP6_9BURK|nr:tripartite tricarboxylate transporter substrate binding protein [Comamonas piscis]QMV71771.1 tripartite tricarboxylate transporter substrate binding protein [Comamonas piscis]WSO34495.1 tripartite tricarboxylate transporter substrate binding protein [Comamonas piscis]
MHRRTFASLLAAIAPLFASGHAWADNWPTRPLKLIVPYAAGGPTDAIARMIGTKMAASLGQPVVVDNRAGAGGTIGVDATVKSPADGHQFALVAPGPLAGMPNLTKVPYSLDDLEFLTLAARIPSVIVVNRKSGITSLEQLIAKAKAAPNTLNYSSAGAGTTPHIGFELFKRETGAAIVHVPYKGAAPAISAVLSGEVQMTMVDLLPILPFAANGNLVVLAVAGKTRAPQLPDVPTTVELGLPNVLMETTYGLIAPKGIPAGVQTQLREAAVAAINSPEMKERFLKQGAIAATSTPAEYRSLMQAESDKWRGVISSAKITLD